MNQSLDLDLAGALLRTVVDTADGISDLAERRLALLECMARLTDSDSGHWSWGRARPESENVLAVGFIPFNYSDAALVALNQFMLDPRMQCDFHRRLQDHIRRHVRADGVWSVITRDALPEVATSPDHWITQAMHQVGVGQWMQGGRYLPDGSFSVMVLGRTPGKPEYCDAERDLMDLVFTNIPWLWPRPDESLPQKEVEVLSPRQRAVAFLVLDGLGRKKIAARLGISEETVNHHMKAVFQHFQVQSATELAALFLRRQ